MTYNPTSIAERSPTTIVLISFVVSGASSLLLPVGRAYIARYLFDSCLLVSVWSQEPKYTEIDSLQFSSSNLFRIPEKGRSRKQFYVKAAYITTVRNDVMSLLIQPAGTQCDEVVDVCHLRRYRFVGLVMRRTEKTVKKTACRFL